MNREAASMPGRVPEGSDSSGRRAGDGVDVGRPAPLPGALRGDGARWTDDRHLGAAGPSRRHPSRPADGDRHRPFQGLLHTPAGDRAGRRRQRPGRRSGGARGPGARLRRLCLRRRRPAAGSTSGGSSRRSLRVDPGGARDGPPGWRSTARVTHGQSPSVCSPQAARFAAALTSRSATMAARVVVAAVGALGEGELGSHRTARRARLRAREPAVRDDQPPAVAGRLVAQLAGEFAPALVTDRLRERDGWPSGSSSPGTPPPRRPARGQAAAVKPCSALARTAAARACARPSRATA